MGEFKWISMSGPEVQKLLNQWKHQYTISIVTSNIERVNEEMVVSMLVYRVNN